MHGRGRRSAGTFLVVIASTVFSLVTGLLVLQGYESLLGADIPHNYCVEPRPVLWEADPELGFRNRAHLKRRIFGKRVCETNGAGFRDRREFSSERPPDVFRIVGVGDSVMWGSGVDQEDSFLAVLEKLLAQDFAKPEVINAGVVGYATYQERLVFEKRVVPYAPDLILVNFCANDYLPTEDPFGNVREVYATYLRSVSATHRAAVEVISSVLESPHAWSALKRATRDGETQRSLREMLIDRPIIEMARIARERDIRLIYLLIPLTFEAPRERALQRQVRNTLSENGIEFIDFSDAFRENPAVYRLSRSFEESLVHRIITRSGLRGLLHAVSLEMLDPTPSLRNLARLRTVQEAQESRNYIDRIGHPSRRGNRIIAERIRQYLATHGSVPANLRR